MTIPYQHSTLLTQDNDGEAECIVIDGDVQTGNERVGRRGRLGQRKSNAKKKAPSAPTGEKELQELIRLCEYEVNQDLYRGMGFLERNGMTQNDDRVETDNAKTISSSESSKTDSTLLCQTVKTDKIVTPWDICQWGILSMSKTIGPGDGNTLESKTQEDSVILDSEDPEDLVRNLTESCCPAILAWTKEHLEEVNRKKQQSQKSKKQRKTIGKKRNRSSLDQDVEDSNNFPRLGLRPSDTNYHCPCDANPFCLGSMGGVVNKLLTERCQQGITISIIDEDEGGKTEDSKDAKRAKVSGFGKDRFSAEDKCKKGQDAEIEILDVDQNSSTEMEETESQKSNASSVFAFGGTSDALSKLGKLVKSAITDKGKAESKTLVPTTATCKRLGPEWSKPETGEPAGVFSSNSISNEPFDEDGYSQTTRDELAKLRASEHVDISKLKRFIENIFELSEPSNTIAMTMDEYIRTVTEWHKSLIFVNPTIEERDMSNDKLTIALPPGIQNLGATCYLNTQLQCLAQIPVFLDALCSWRPVNSSTQHKMNGVMTKLQKLLAQMLVGGDRKYTSLDFSNALGIQHNEQQDPNEFARLLFDRMEESFQQCSANNIASGSRESVNKGDGLGKLLHRIFHGTTTYETICMKCGKTSVRSEGFMDLNLPIVHREHNEEDSDDSDELDTNNQVEQDDPGFVKRKRRKKSVLEKAFEKQKRKNPADTDVQYCFNQYTKAEMLEGDNQYFCDACDCKQDAKRVMSLTELPPVLNIQLSRYVFDREKFIKKKLTDKVRLPTILKVNQQQGGAEGNIGLSSDGAVRRKPKPKKKYILCAVMKHRGTSAYSGHYIAEAMDWTIGQWYEFNDEIVKVLPKPSNSYIPCNPLHSEDDGEKSEAKSTGSEDAYNMYYVDEEYLAENAIATMSRNKHLSSLQTGDTKNDTEETDVLFTLIREKAERYSVLTEFCHADYAIAERLRRRKDGIFKYMLVDSSSLLLQEGQPKDKREPYVWVDGKALRQFFACDRSLDDKLRSNEPIVCPEASLCPHGSVHPRVAKSGKLLRKSIYDAYTSLLSGERNYLSQTTEMNESDVVGRVIDSKGKIICEHCSNSYRNELSQRLDFLRNIYDLYLDILDETKDSTKSERTDSTEDEPQEEYAYIVTRSTITKFKKLVLDLMKSVADFEKGGYTDNSSAQLENKRKFILYGIDDLDTSSFPGGQAYLAHVAPNTESVAMNDGIDVNFNSKITCSHRNCSDFGLRIVRYVSYKIWTKIKKVFPDAIEHKISLYAVDGTKRRPNIEDDGCLQCRTEKDAIDNLKTDVEKWARETKGNFVLKKLLDEKKISAGEIAFHNFDNAQNNCRLVHRDDITNLCKAVKQLGRFSKSKISELSELKAYVENIAFPSYHRVVLEFEKQPNARLLQSIRSLTCCEHQRVIKSAIIDSAQLGGEELEHRCQLSNNVAVLSDDEYNSYISSLSELLVILNHDYHKQEGEKDLHDNSSESTLVDEVNEFSAKCHPAIKRTAGENVTSDEILLFSLDGNSKEFSIIPGFCNHETCKKDFAPSVRENVGVAVDSVSVDSRDTKGKPKAHKRKSDSKLGSMAMSPIIVESDLEDYSDPSDNRQKIRVFQYTPDSGLVEALESLKNVLGTPNGGNETGLDFGVRRSSRKRKTKFPVGCITGENSTHIGLHHNVAALRLLLFQDCQTPLGCKLSVVINLGDDSIPKGLDIAFDENTKTLEELVHKLKTAHEDLGDLLESNLFEHLFLLYKVGKDDKSGDIEATLMDSLLQASNIESPNSKGNPARGQKKRNRSSERGFQGTLLQSSNIPPAVDEQKITDDDSCQVDDSKEKKKENKYNSVISDDEIDDIEPKPEQDTASFSSDQEEVAIVPSPPPRAPATSKIGDEKRMQLVCKLIELTESKDESRCFEAVSWAIKSNPKYSEEQVMDAALTKLFDSANS